MRLAIFITALLFTFGAHAEDKGGKPSFDRVCKKWGDLAAKIMELRQTEAPMSQVLGSRSDDTDTAKLTRAIIIQAYEEGAMLSDKNKKRQIDEFRNRIELQCFKNIPE